MPSSSAVSRIAFILAFVGLALLYFHRLSDAPIYLAHDEAMFGVTAHELAWHGRDADGNVLPMFMHMNGVYWNMPAHVYLTALSVRLFGTNEAAIRVSSVVASLVAVLLIYWFCRRVFRHRGFAALAAGMLALSPAFFIDSRLSTDHHYPVVAIGLWLLCLARFFDDPERNLWLALAGVSLGLGVYTYGASVLLMPLYVAITAIVLLKARVHRVLAYAAFLVCFALAVAPFVFFVVRNPGYVGDVANMYNVYDAKRFGVLQGARELGSWTSLGARADVYFSYFNPSMLFFSGGGSLLQSTRQAGFFLTPFIVLLPVAALFVLRHDVDWFASLALLAFVVSPLAAAIVDEHGAVQRVMSLAPFAAILVAYFVMRASVDSRPWVRAGVWLLVALLPVSFARFYVDYLGDYRQRSSFYFEQNIGGALEAAIQQAESTQPAGNICISRGINPLVDWYWKFYLRKHAAESLEAHTIYFDNAADARNKCAPGVVVVSEIALCDPIAATRARAPEKIAEPGGSSSFCVF
jgi:4-amino-4-deoxy-L-arabinose transferase-like glycosyltransferase